MRRKVEIKIKRIMCVLVSLMLLLTTPALVYAAGGNTPALVYNPFADVQRPNYVDNYAGSLCYDSVMWAYTTGITSGLGKSYFGKDETVTRAQAVTFLWRAMGKPETRSKNNPFNDVSSTDWFYKPVLWAVENRICAGTGKSSFSPDQSCTYAHMVTFLHRVMKEPDCNKYSANYSNFMIEFEKKEHEWYTDAAMWAGCYGVLGTGLPGADFGIRVSKQGIVQDCPRQDVVEMLYIFEAKRSKDGLYPKVETKHIMSDIRCELPGISKEGRANGKDYYISLDVAGTKLLNVNAGGSTSKIGPDPYGATRFRITKIGAGDILASVDESGGKSGDEDVIKTITAGKAANYSTIRQHLALEYALTTRADTNSYVEALTIQGEDDFDSPVAGSHLTGQNTQLFDLVSAGKDKTGRVTTYIKTVGGNYMAYEEGTGLYITDEKSEATAFYFMPVIQFGY